MKLRRGSGQARNKPGAPLNSNVVQGYPSSEEVRKPYGRFLCASSKNMGASVEDQEAPC